MTEHKCGSAKSCKYGDMCKPNFNIGACSHYKEEEPQTNEEWFCSLPTEEKAVIFSLLSYRCNICDGTPTNQCPFDRCVRGLKDFIKWLKQPHRNE